MNAAAKKEPDQKSEPSATANARKAWIRVAANFVGGMFHYIPKKDLIDLGLLEVFLYLVTKTYPQGEAIAKFVSNIEVAACEALKGLKTRFKGLTVDDFGYIHQLTLWD
jgi:hypothetical protein